MRHLVILLLLFQFCTQSVAQISVVPEQGCAPLAGVQFEHEYSNASDFLWLFGDGSSANTSSAVHTYINPGTYTVQFSATVNGSEVSDSFTVTVFENPSASFTNVPTACEGQAVTFTSTSTGANGSTISNYDWAFGDGAIEQGPDASPVYIYNNIGSYDVSLTVTDSNGCIASTTVNGAITVTEGPDINITTSPSPATTCNPPLDLSFINTSTGNNLQWEWDFDNGQTSTSANPNPVTYIDIGNYTVTAIATDASGCSVQTNIPVIVASNTAELIVESAENDTTCAEVTFSVDTPAGSVLINYGDGEQGSSYQHTYTSGGWYTATAIVTNGSCVTTDLVDFYVEFVTADFTLNPDDFDCSDPLETQTINTSQNAISYEWLYEGQTSNAFEPFLSIPLAQPDTFDLMGSINMEILLTATSENGCVATDVYNISISRPTALHYPDSIEGCLPLDLTFTDFSISDDPIVSWTWDFGDGTVITQTNGDPVNHVYTEPGEYFSTLIIENSIGCIDTSFAHHIYVGEPFELIVDAFPPIGCPGEVSIFSGQFEPPGVIDSIDVWIWNGTEVEINSPDDFGSQFIEMPGIHSYEWILGYNGCFDIGQFSYPVKGGGQCNPGEGGFTCTCDNPYLLEFSLDTMNVTSWDIDFGDGTVITNSTDLDVSHTYTEAGLYDVVITAQTTDPNFPIVEISFQWAVYVVDPVITVDTLMQLHLSMGLWRQYHLST